MRAVQPPPQPVLPLDWARGQVLLQGTIGASFLSDFQVDSGAGELTELEDSDYEVLPAIGGGAQLKLAGESIDFGIEGLLELSGRSDLQVLASSGGTVVGAFDVSLLLVELYGGPFVSRNLGDEARIYAAVGPLLQFVEYDQDDPATGESEDEEGIGGGVYARGGLEFRLPSGKLVGFGVRWTDSTIDLGQEIGDLDMEGLEVFFSLSYGYQSKSSFVD